MPRRSRPNSTSMLAEAKDHVQHRPSTASPPFGLPSVRHSHVLLDAAKEPLTSMISTLIADRPPLTSVQRIMLGLRPTRVKTYSAWLRDTFCYTLFQNVGLTFMSEFMIPSDYPIGIVKWWCCSS